MKTLDDPDGLWNALASTAAVLRDPPAGHARPVRLIVVDSISSPFRELDSTQRDELADRTGMLSRVAALLKEYAHRHDVAVVLTNHVSDAVTGGGEGGAGGSHFFNLKQRRLFGPSGDLRSSGRAIVPNLGLFWANCVNTRVFLSRTGGSAGGYDNSAGGGELIGGVRRRAHIVFSSYLPASQPGEVPWSVAGAETGGAPCEFVVRGDGVWGRADEDDVAAPG